MTPDILRSLTASDIRNILELTKHQSKLRELIEERDRHLDRAEKIQHRIDAITESWVDPTLDQVRPGRRGRAQRLGPTVKEMAVEVLKGRKKGLTAAKIKKLISSQSSSVKIIENSTNVRNGRSARVVPQQESE